MCPKASHHRGVCRRFRCGYFAVWVRRPASGPPAKGRNSAPLNAAVPQQSGIGCTDRWPFAPFPVIAIFEVFFAVTDPIVVVINKPELATYAVAGYRARVYQQKFRSCFA